MVSPGRPLASNQKNRTNSAKITVPAPTAPPLPTNHYPPPGWRAAHAAEGARHAQKHALGKRGVRDLVLNLVVRDGWVELPEFDEAVAVAEAEAEAEVSPATPPAAASNQAVDVAVGRGELNEEAVAEPTREAAAKNSVLGFFGRGAKKDGDGGGGGGAAGEVAAADEGPEIDDDELDEL